MVIVDRALAEREAQGLPIRVALVGAGVTGRMIALQLLAPPIPGMRLVAIANRTGEKAAQAFQNAGIDTVTAVDSLAGLEDCVAQSRPAIVEDASLVCQAANIDVIVEVTGTVEYGGRVAMDAIRHRKHVVLVNAELDSTIGPILRFHADRAGVVITNTDGDEPGVAMTLLRYVKTIGFRPVAAGNLKGIMDRYRTPETQREFAAKYGQDAGKVTSFADGTKLSMEATILANATGFRVGRRGMYGPKCAHVREMATLLPPDDLLNGGLVDYALGAEPHTGAFVIGYEEHRQKRKELAYYKMGDGPFYVFYTPYHLPHIQIVSTIARAALFGDATVSPIGAPACEVATFAKRDLKAGDRLDGVGGFMSYGVIDNAEAFALARLLPMGIAGGCRLLRDVPKDDAITYADVALPSDRLCDRLRAEQVERLGIGLWHIAAGDR
jgi:predicted homoserine dehydrogenase-like protein